MRGACARIRSRPPAALTGSGVEALKGAIATKVRLLREEARERAASEARYDQVWQHRRDDRNAVFDVFEEEPGTFRVAGRQVERMVVQTDWENEEALLFLQHRLRRLGVDDALREAGARNGDEIRISGRAFDYEAADDDEDVYRELDL